ncbi:MAG: phosphoribosyltransferase [Verrucomicrobia bacterium]|nr:phosphoribosyltransferase [Verrucomicrobiota bacterium]
MDWNEFPLVVVHSTVAKLKSHPAYGHAKTGSPIAALKLAEALVKVGKVAGPLDYVVPIALARVIARSLGARVWLEIVQTNVVGHTKASGEERLLRQPDFGGDAPPAGSKVLICDDVVTYGSSFANLRGYLERQGTRVVKATALGAGYGATRLAPPRQIIDLLKEQHGADLDAFTQRLGFRPEQLTAREAFHLSSVRSLKRYRSGLAQAHEPPARGLRRHL